MATTNPCISTPAFCHALVSRLLHLSNLLPHPPPLPQPAMEFNARLRMELSTLNVRNDVHPKSQVYGIKGVSDMTTAFVTVSWLHIIRPEPHINTPTEDCKGVIERVHEFGYVKAPPLASSFRSMIRSLRVSCYGAKAVVLASLRSLRS